jgi:LAS superfamily LD-carboxypeptidase LdcB
MRTRRLALAVAAVAVLAACGETDDPNELLGEPPAPEESADGADAVDPNEHGDDGAGAATLDTPIEASDPHLDPMQQAVEQAAPGTPEAEAVPPEAAAAVAAATATCQRATGYRSGKAFTICVTSIDGKLVEINTARAFLKMRAAAKARGVAVRIVSGFRTMAQQRYLYNCYVTRSCNNGNLAARPGYSNHQSGHALDLNTSSGGVYTFLSNHGRAYGFRRTVPSERWHWERW